MKKLFFSWGLATVILIFSGCASTEDRAATSGDTSRRANLSGTITTGPMLKMAPLETRGVKKIALIVDFKPEVSFKSVGLTMFQNKQFTSEGAPMISESDVVGMFSGYFATNSNIGLVDLTSDKQSYLPHLKISAWDGKATFGDSAQLSSKLTELKQAGIDAILVVEEDDLSDFMGLTNQRLGPKGLYNRFKTVSVYGGFRVRLMDVATKTQMKHASYVQASSQPTSSISWKESFTSYSESERTKIAEELKAIYLVNIDESMRMLKANKNQ